MKRSLALALLGTALSPAMATAQMSRDFHFQSDTSREAIVDDRGGQGSGFSFAFDYDDREFSSENHCTHCSFSVFISDPDLHLPDLEQLGVTRDQIETATGLVSALQALAATDPATIAMQVHPGLMGADLDAFIMEATATLTEVEAVLMRLETLVMMQDGVLDWEAWDDMGLTSIIDLLSLRHDSAFRADFHNPNDPRGHNSGVAVYNLPSFVDALIAEDVPMDARTAIESALSSIPSLPGAFELSGDDDDPLRPASYHGIRTDLTINQRTYVVNGHSAMLYVFTIVNDTTRILPWVAASMIADFDIRPGVSDSETDFDPALQAVMVYDSQPLLDPEQHHWFGVAAATPPTPAPGVFSFVNYNLDKNLSLSQFAGSIESNRHRFYMWHPDVSGDHDDATAKSEKQGAIMTLLGGPMLPGDQRSVAFCMANGQGLDSGSARAAFTATMTACKAMYTFISPNCGDGILQFGEECEPATSLTVPCTTSCERQVCGDGRINGTESCDDGNTVDGDGCSAACNEEVCGNGELTPNEECDDGNPSNNDACLNNCLRATCGDGFVKDCTLGDCSDDCGGRDYCFEATITFGPDTVRDELDILEGIPLSMSVGFDANNLTQTGINGIEVNPLMDPVVTLTGHPLAEGPIQEALNNTTPAESNMRITDGSVPFLMLIGGSTATGERYTFSFQSTRRGVGLSLGRGGVPYLTPTTITAGLVNLNGPVGPATTQFATGSYDGAVGVGGTSTEANELCDDGNASNFDACTAQCVPAACGDGFLQLAQGEECDEGMTPPAWCVDCMRVNLAACGNGTVDAAAGELCDDNNTADDDGCSSLCQPESCGDGIVQSGEECDDGANGDDDGCTDACIVEFCGDGIVQRGEECDDAAANADDAACLSTCLAAACGDGLVGNGEECDDGNDEFGDGCSSTCTTEFCGDGLLGMGEECDDGGTTEGDGCNPVCLAEYCGDGLPGPEEQCDDANAVTGDGCDKDCLLENLEDCGDGTVGPGEQCDDGATTDGDGCSMFCQLENPASCGNGMIDVGEQCDDGNEELGDGCTNSCVREACGDGIHNWGERCDDGNNVGGDGCSASCDAELWTCGNGVHEWGEECDDGNGSDSDSCNGDCEAPPGAADLRTTCGNGVLDYGEECDDGAREEGDSCDVLCQREALVCGNSSLEYYELCDDGNTDPDDGCDENCELEGLPEESDCSCDVPGGSSQAPWGALGLMMLLGAWLRRRRPH